VSNLDLVEETCGRRGTEQIVGNSSALRSALDEVKRVAPTDATVLVLGETGTGKELTAHAIHALSGRRDGPFIKVDCAAIPFELLESELFGHEKGAFPWATAQRIGLFEMADTGTMFLDEIGDLPLALQPKLLRVLEEQEFERPGSGRTLRVNVRLVAATHRDLAEMVKQKEFRSDLYYRLCGFPVVLPPLRERNQDVALLVSHFAKIFSRRLSKRIHHIPEETMRAFAAHSWPGNVRELQNMIERAVILSNDGVLPNPLTALHRNWTGAPGPGAFNGMQRGAMRSKIGSDMQSGIRAIAEPSRMPEEHAAPNFHRPGHELGSREMGKVDTSAQLPVVFVVDGDTSVRGSMEELIRREGWQPETFALAQEFLDRPRALVPNCLVLDVPLKDLNCLELQKRIVVERTETPVIFMAGEGDVPTSVQAMKAGAVEFLIKPYKDEALVNAIKEGLRRSSIALGRETEMRSLRNRYAALSPRERQVMALVVTGLLNKQVGSELGISESTVKGHRGRLVQKMGAKSVPDLVRMAARLRAERAYLASRECRPADRQGRLGGDTAQRMAAGARPDFA